MPVVKNVHARELIRNAVVFDLGDVREKAEAILQAARDSAEKIITDAHEEAARLTQGADERGHSAGHDRGLAEGRAEGLETGHSEGESKARESLCEQLKAIEASWIAALQDWNTRRSVQLEEGRRDLLQFAVKIAERIVGRLPEYNSQQVLEQVFEAMDLLIDRTKLTVRIHPLDSALVKSHLPGILEHFGSESDAHITADPKVSRGGCIVWTPDGEVDGRLETQLARIVNEMLPELNEDEKLEQRL